MIEQGSLVDGHQLPSTRILSEQLGVARITVSGAYTKLKAQGFIEFKRNARPIVIGRDTLRLAPILMPQSAQEICEQLSDFGRRVSQMEIIRSTSADLPELGYGTANLETLPIKQWQTLVRQTCERMDFKAEIALVEDLGYRPLRAAIAEYVGRTRGIACAADNVVVFGGAQQTLNLIGSLLIQPGDVVAIEDPGFIGARQAFRSYGAELHPVPLDTQGATIPAVQRAKLLYVSSLHQDPTGIVMPLDRRQQLCRWAARNDALIVEDDFDHHFRSSGKSVPALAAIDGLNRVIYVSTFWKSLYPLCQVGFAIVPTSLVDAFHRAKLLAERSFSLLENVVLARFLSGGGFEQYIEKSRKAVMERRRTLIIALTKAFGSKIEFNKQAGGTHLCLTFDKSFDEHQIGTTSAKAGVPLVSTKLHYLRQAPPREYLLHFSNLRPEAVESCVSGWAKLLVV